ncbi:unnamed protein product [Rhizopus microsporus]
MISFLCLCGGRQKREGTSCDLSVTLSGSSKSLRFIFHYIFHKNEGTLFLLFYFDTRTIVCNQDERKTGSI